MSIKPKTKKSDQADKLVREPQRACGRPLPSGQICIYPVLLSGFCSHCKLFTNSKLRFDGHEYVQVNVSDDPNPVPHSESKEFLHFLQTEFRAWPPPKRREFVRLLEEQFPDYDAAPPANREPGQEG